MIAEQIARELTLPIEFVEGLARTASREYRFFSIPKRSGNGFRQISHPSRQLKALQRWLLREVIERFPIHPVAKAYRSGVSTLDNALCHAGSNFLLRMDFQDFFESITLQDIQAYLTESDTLFSEWSQEDKHFFGLVVCRFGRLTIGAPTSPSLSNAICIQMERTIERRCEELGITYTRYADDLFFSTLHRDTLQVIEGEIPGILKGLRCPSNLVLNQHKTRYSSKRGARHVTGLTLGSDGKVYVGRPLKREIRAIRVRWNWIQRMRMRCSTCGS